MRSAATASVNSRALSATMVADWMVERFAGKPAGERALVCRFTGAVTRTPLR